MLNRKLLNSPEFSVGTAPLLAFVELHTKIYTPPPRVWFALRVLSASHVGLHIVNLFIVLCSESPVLLKRCLPARWLLSVMPYEPLGDDEKIKATHIPPTFSVHKYSSAVGMGSAGENFGVQPERPRTQQVLRMGRSFSTRLSTKGDSALSVVGLIVGKCACIA